MRSPLFNWTELNKIYITDIIYDSRAISKRCMEITQEDAGASDECYDCAIDHEFGNTDTVNLHR